MALLRPVTYAMLESASHQGYQQQQCLFLYKTILIDFLLNMLSCVGGGSSKFQRGRRNTQGTVAIFHRHCSRKAGQNNNNYVCDSCCKIKNDACQECRRYYPSVDLLAQPETITSPHRSHSVCNLTEQQRVRPSVLQASVHLLFITSHTGAGCLDPC
ncbi:hypothetical protein CBL_05540 [Carabus blaptoides fortunei]